MSAIPSVVTSLPAEKKQCKNAMDSTDFTDFYIIIIRVNPWNPWRFCIFLIGITRGTRNHFRNGVIWLDRTALSITTLHPK
jgi:hypothetical protein